MRPLPPGFVLLLLAALALAACGGDDPPADGWRALPAAAVTPAAARQLARADEARQQFATRLLGELTRAMAEHGAAGAVAVCRVRAPALAAAIGTEHGLRLGRCADRRRNPQNQPPAWASAHVATGRIDPATYVGPGGVVGVLQPILLQPLCVACHGRPDQLEPGVAEALGEHYPEDRATGFAPGDLRGWFWLEVPPSRGS